MRSKPNVSIDVVEQSVCSGERVELTAQVSSSTPTEVSSVRVRLKGVERSHRGKSNQTRVCLDLRAEYPGALVGPGAPLVVAASLEVPNDALPSYSNAGDSIVYTLSVEAVVPWWFNGRERYSLDIKGSARPRVLNPARTELVFGGAGGTELNIDVALESDELNVACLLRGAVALQNVEHHRVKQLELTLRGLDRNDRPVETWPLASFENPKSGVPYPFNERLSARLRPSFKGELVSLRWQLEARAVVSLAFDSVVQVPLTLLALPRGGFIEPPTPVYELVGAARSTQVWNAVATAEGFQLEGDAQVLTMRSGMVAVRITRGLRNNVAQLEAKLEWPSVGLGLELTQRSWLGSLTISGEPFVERFSVRGHRLSAFFSPALQRALLEAKQLVLTDTGGEVIEPAENGATRAGLVAFVQRVGRIAKALDEAITALGAPEEFVAQLEAYRAEASALGGRVEMGSLSIRDATFKGYRVEIVRMPNAESWAAPVARVFLAAPARPSPESERIAEATRRECPGFLVSAEAVEAQCDDVTRAQSLLRALHRVAVALSGAI